jgi:FixJ family two-component response regulator
MTSITVFIVDDEAGIRDSIALLMQTCSLQTACFASANEFLSACGPNPRGCLILDVRMPGMNGLQLQDELILRCIHLPIIFLTGHADVPMTVGAIRKGALDVIVKPVSGDMLLELVHNALEADRLRYLADSALTLFTARLLKLTARERQVLSLALSGMPNKTMADELGISLRTIEGHRTRIYLKLGVDSLIELAQQATSAGMSMSALTALPPA